MASKIGLSYRNEAAQARLGAALAELGEGDAGAQPPGSRRDGALEATLRLEWTADVLERTAERAKEQARELSERNERIAELEAQLAKRSGEASRAARAAKRGE